MIDIHTLACKLKELAIKTINGCTFEKDVTYFGRKEKMKVLLPSGDEKYRSFWVRDAAMMIESGLICNDDVKRYIEIFALCGQNGKDTLYLENGLTVPPYAVADHINYDGKPVYFPGTESSGDDQGDGNFGYFPPFCDNFYFIIAVAQYVKQSDDYGILNNIYGDITLLKRIERAFFCYNIDETTGLCVGDSEKYTVDWGFADSVKKSGKLLVPSILRYNAGNLLCGILQNMGDMDLFNRVNSEVTKLKQSIINTFFDEETGWFYSATGIGRQYDVWGTAYIVFSKITDNSKTLTALHNGYSNKMAVLDGQVRHILLDDDYSEASAWEKALTPKNVYQNGGYWATATGWYAYALYKYNGEAKILEDFLTHFEMYKDKGAPFEWVDANTENYSGLYYGTSGVLPYISIKRIIEDLAKE